MRTLLFASLSLLAVGCFSRAETYQGTVSYTATPPIEGSSGALRTNAVFCYDGAGPMKTGVRLSEHCVISQRGLQPLQAAGECLLPTSKGEVPIKIETVALTWWRAPFEAVIGGTTPDGTYLNYRFSGGDNVQAAPSGACDAVLVPSGPGTVRPPPPEEAQN